MKFINFDRGARKNLSESQRSWFKSLASLSQRIQYLTISKVGMYGCSTRYGIFPSLVMAHCITVSLWGQHPAAQDKYPVATASRGWVHGNNLWLLEADEGWQSTVLKFNGRRFKTYSNWGTFAADLSDVFSINQNYRSILASEELSNQVYLLVNLNHQLDYYEEKVRATLQRFDLGEFDGQA